METRFCTVLAHELELYKNMPGGEKKKKAEQLLTASGKAGKKEEMYWEETCCRIHGEHIEQEFSYEGLRGIQEKERYFLVLFGGGAVVAVDKKGFRQGKPDRFAAFIREKLGEKQ